MNLESWTGLIALIISILALLVSLYYNRKDHERRRKQATIEYFEDMTSKMYDAQARFNTKLNQLDIEISKLDTDKELLKDATEVLAAFERLCVGVNTNVFDLDILDRMSGSYLIMMYYRFSPYIKEIRTDASRTSSYMEFEHVVHLIEQRRNTISKKGKI